jgi:hypothetical protein
MNIRISRAEQSHRARGPVFLLLGALLLGASACNVGSNATPSTGGQATSTPSTGGQATTTPKAGAPASGRDVLAMNACTLFPAAVVATALNATLADPNNPGKGSGGPSCTYFLLPSGAGTGGGQLYILNLISPKLFDPSLSALVNAQPVAGLGDKAFMGTRVGTTTHDLMVLKSGDIGIEVVGDDAAMVQKLAEYVLANLP